MDKNILEQYADLIAEREDLQKRIKATELKIMQLCDETVADPSLSVSEGRNRSGGR